MPRGTFHLVGLDEGGVRGRPDNLRLVCLIQSAGKLAIWGKHENRHNIDAVMNAGVPCTVECEYREPNPIHAQNFGHTHWVPEDFELKVVA
jgi:hypothetical protein